ncbi:hypothetical protein ACH5RR_001126 [Cinchona calisaya]|uniref:SWIM-type domain-containing protein n=1 Tax=Cinchona calisaya TaxID=153742 RepID=A0ABD3B2K2_9GENT
MHRENTRDETITDVGDSLEDMRGLSDDLVLINVEDINTEYDSSSGDDLWITDGSSDDEQNGTRKSYPVFNEKVDKRKPKFTVGMMFKTSKIFRMAVRMHSILDGREIKFKKNDEFRRTPSLTVTEFANKVSKELNVEFSWRQAYRTKQKILDKIEGAYVEQFAKLQDYCSELRSKNPGPNGGQLLTAVGIDANNEMEKMQEDERAAWLWLLDKDPIHWSRSHFRTYVKCDILVNSMCESFNATILKARDKPILTMLQNLYLYLMKRLQVNREKMSQIQGSLCPRIVERLEKNNMKKKECIPRLFGGMKYQVSHIYGDQFAVDLETKTCSSRQWELKGIPCNHAVAHIFLRRGKPKMFVDDYYNIEAYKKSYEPPLNPFNGPILWQKNCPTQSPTS